MLATQNPADLDYKGLSNAGTWLIGRLQADRDKQRLLDGLEGAAASGAFDRAKLEQTIAGLGKRVFLMNNVHESRTGRVRVALGAVLPARAADARPDPDADGRPGTRRGRARPRGRTAAAPVAAAAVRGRRTGSGHAGAAAGAAPAAAPMLPPDVPRYYMPARAARRRPARRCTTCRWRSAAPACASATACLGRSTLLAPLSDGAVTIDWDGADDAGVAAGRSRRTRPRARRRYGEVPAAAAHEARLHRLAEASSPTGSTARRR